MKRIFFLLMCSLMAVASLQAQEQKLLSVEETTEGIGVYPSENRHEALVVFVCREPFGLSFESTTDKDLVVQMDSIAGEKRYSIVFTTQAPGVSYEGRRLRIMAEGFKPYNLPLSLKDKQKFEYTVSDPYSALRSPYFLYWEKANDLFYAGEYQGAKDTYEMVKSCPEYFDNLQNREAIDQHVALCDSMIEWAAEAEQLERFKEYYDAFAVYQKMLRHNSGNENIKQAHSRAIQNFYNDCQAQYDLGAMYQENGEFDKARACFEHIIEQNCQSATTNEATLKLSEIRKAKAKRDQHARALFYDFGQNLPIGLTFGLFYPDRTSGYISLRLNPSLINAAAGRNYAEGEWINENNSYKFLYDESVYATTGEEFHDGIDQKDDKYYPIVPKEFDQEASISFGWTCNVWEPIYLHWGIGYHGGGYNVARLTSEIKDDDIKNVLENYNTTFSTSQKHKASRMVWTSAPLVEAGIVLKYWRANIKFTYQFNYWLGYDDEITGLEEFYNDQRHKFYFGVGFCW